MESSKILIVPKITKVEWDMRRLGFTETQLKEFYDKEGLNTKKIFDSHKKQKESLKLVKQLLKDSTIISRDELNKEAVKNYDLVISFGGDNHFQFVSHFLDNTPILGINSDPKRSEGALTTVNAVEFGRIFRDGLNDNFKIEEWTRLQVEIDGKETRKLALSEVFIGEEKRFNMSRHIIRLKDNIEEQKGSGLLISTGAGSTGWYNSSSRYLFSKGDIFSKFSNEARFILTEPYNGKLSKYKLMSGKINNKEFLEIISLSDSSPYLSIDSLKLIKLRECAKVKIKIGNPLKVVKLK